MLFDYLHYILLFFQIILGIFVSYLLILTIAAWFAPKRTLEVKNGSISRLAILIPAHDEEIILPELLSSIKNMSYPVEYFDVHVIADNCTDNTATVAKKYGAHVHVRSDQNNIGKGYALDWCLRKLWSEDHHYEAYIFVDADTVVAPNLLNVLNNQVNQGAKIVQVYYGVKDAGLSWNVSLRYAALAVLHFLRPQGRMVLGCSAGLKGNGMLFTEDVLVKHPWPASVTEDIEYHMILLLDDYSVKFAPDTAVWGEMPKKFEQSQSQLARWEHGRLDMARYYVPKLLIAAFHSLKQLRIQNFYKYVDAVMEHLIPPFSILVSAVIGCLLGAILLLVFGQLPFTPTINSELTWVNVSLAFIMLAGLCVYLFSGLAMVKAPKIVYQQMIFAPIFMLRKIGHYAGVVFGRGPEAWIKTTRNQN